MKDKTIAILESRMRDHIASLVRKYGGTPFLAPALAEIPDVDPAHIDELIRAWNSAPPDIFTLLRGKRVVVQRYGETNRELQAALESEGADVIEIVTYRWGLPEDTAPLLRLIGALDRDEIDLVAFTSASQASNLFTVAQNDGKEASLKQSLGRTLVASIGPVCSVALRKLAVRVDIEANPPKLGPFIEAINAVLSDRRPLGKS
jgi:uroporphyrinogen-III synthase